MEVKVIGQMDNTIDHTFESANRVYDTGGVAPTINTCGGGGLQPKILEDAQAIRMVRTEEGKALRKEYESGAIHHGFNEHREMELRTDGVSNTLSTVQKDNYICEKSIVAMRGRNPDNPSDRTAGVPTEQRLEPNSKGICNMLTSVQKDNLVMEYKAIDEQNMCVRNETFGTLTTDGSSPKHNNRGMELYLSDKGKKYVCDPKRGMCTDINSDVCQTLTAKGQSNWTGSFVSPDIEKLEKSATIGSNEPTTIHLKNGEYITSDDDLTQYRIRKLTPLECWRLMDFTDEDFYKAEAVNSNTQLYKQAGNSIVKNVLMQIFKQMI